MDGNVPPSICSYLDLDLGLVVSWWCVARLCETLVRCLDSCGSCNAEVVTPMSCLMLWTSIRIDGSRVLCHSSANTPRPNTRNALGGFLSGLLGWILYSCVYLSPGYSLCLGKSYFFRFNHPEEASRMKSMLPQKSPVSPLVYSTGNGSHISTNSTNTHPHPNYPNQHSFYHNNPVQHLYPVFQKSPYGGIDVVWGEGDGFSYR